MNIIEFSGEVVGTETWSQTRVSGKSSGMSIGGIGASNGRTTSTVTNVGQVWVKTDEGQEIAVRVNPDKFATREGHRVSMIVSANKSGPAHMIAAVNHATGKSRRESALAVYFLVPMAVIFLGWIPVLLIFALPPVGLLAAALFVWAMFSMITRAIRIDHAGSSFLGKMASGAIPRPAQTAAAGDVVVTTEARAAA